MFDLLKKSIFATIGIAVLAKDKIEESARKVADEAKLTEAEGKRFVDEILKKSDETRAALQKVVTDTVDLTLQKINIPTRKEMSELEKRICRLETQINLQDKK